MILVMPESRTCLGFDFGMKRIGVAVGQTLLKTAKPLDTIAATQGTPDWSCISTLINQWHASVIVVGIPYNMDGSVQGVTHAARAFANQCRKRFSCQVFGVDERLTTQEARQLVFEQGGKRALEKAQIDSIAAKLILESWMNESGDSG